MRARLGMTLPRCAAAVASPSMCGRGGVWAWWSVGVREPPCDVDAVLRQARQKTASVRGTPHGTPVAHNASARRQPQRRRTQQWRSSIAAIGPKQASSITLEQA